MEKQARASGYVYIKHPNGEHFYDNDFESGMVVGAKQAGLIIAETDNLLGFSHTTVSTIWHRIVRKYFFKPHKTYSEKVFLLTKTLVDERS